MAASLTTTPRVPHPAAPTAGGTVALSAAEARRIALRAQGLLGAADRRGGVQGILRRLGAVQLDTISVLARSHELVPYARLGAVGRGAVERAYWGAGAAFEYWSHAACVLPVEVWPYFAFRRRAFRDRGRLWSHPMAPEAYGAVLERVRADGPLTATELGGAKRGGPWWDWSDAKVAVERALAFGELVCVERRGWKRVYDLPERAIPGPLLDTDLDDAACLRHLVGLAGAALGVATEADLADHHRLTVDQVRSVISDSGLIPVTVEGWSAPTWAAPEALAAPPRGRHRTTLLSPFDSLVWDRRRTRRLFGFHHRLEAYVPRQKREHGYYAMPLLAGGALVGRVDPAREGRTLVGVRVGLETAKAVEPMAQALREAATWVGADAVRVGEVRVAGAVSPSTAVALQRLVD